MKYLRQFLMIENSLLTTANIVILFWIWIDEKYAESFVNRSAIIKQFYKKEISILSKQSFEKKHTSI